MPNTYKLTATKVTGSGITILYTAPVATTTLIKSLYISNIATGSVYMDVIINKSGSPINYYLISGSLVPPQASFQPISDTLALQAGDIIKVNTNVVSGSDALLSYLEIT